MLSPRMRCQRTAVSMTVWSSMWPICSDPVTFGGGTTSEKVGPGAIGIGMEDAGFHPPLGPVRLESLRLISFFQFHEKITQFTKRPQLDSLCQRHLM